MLVNDDLICRSEFDRITPSSIKEWGSNDWPTEFNPALYSNPTLEADMKNRGYLLHPIVVLGVVRKRGKKTYILIAGRRRLAAALRLEWKRISATVLSPQSKADIGEIIAELSFTENHARDSNVPQDCSSVKRFLNHGLTKEEICKRLHLPAATYDRLYAISQILSPLYDEFREGKISATVAARISRLNWEEQRLLLKDWKCSEAPRLTGKFWVNWNAARRRKKAGAELPDFLLSDIEGEQDDRVKMAVSRCRLAMQGLTDQERSAVLAALN